MASQVTNYQCPSCTGPLHFVGESGKLECEYCGGTFDVAEIEALYEQKEQKAKEAFAAAEQKAANGEDTWDVSELSRDWGEDGAKMKVYNCPSCGAELICDETTAATSCPYCDNPSIVPGQLSGALKPDYIIPFKLNKNAAKEALKNFYKGKKLLPKAFSDENHIEEIKGIYVPFWMFDGKADADVEFAATRTHSFTDGKYRVTETSHFLVRRSGTVPFEKIPADASTKMPDNYMDAIEPFDYSELKEFSTAYLPGYLADKYDVSAAMSSARADERAANSAVASMRASISGYETCIEQSRNIRLHRGHVKYALMPVYILDTKWGGKDYLFAMNGQTGKVVGNLPVSWAKYWAWFAGISIPTAIIVGTICMFFV